MNVPHELNPGVVRRPLPAAMLQALRSGFGERYSSATAVCEQHGRDDSPFPTTPPEAVVYCESTDDVTAVLRLAHEYGVPVIPYGVGTSLEGHLLAVQGGVSVDLSRMCAIVQLNPEDLTVIVQAGVTREQLNQAVRDLGLFFPTDPGANATLGGMAATRASGTNAVRAVNAQSRLGLCESPMLLMEFHGSEAGVREQAETVQAITGDLGGDNFHLAYLVKEGDLEQRAQAEGMSLRMVQRAIALEGTCSGEHGIGLHEMGFLIDEAGAGCVALMRSIKHALDPKNIMNPGKIFDW